MTTPAADADCMARLRCGDDLALNALMDRWQKPLATFLLRYTGNEATALDLAQETFVRVYENRHTFRGGAFSSWLFSIAVNLCKNHARWQARHPTVTLDAQGACEIPSPSASPDAQAASEELAAAVRAAIHGLPHDLKTVTLLFEYQEQSHSEIAAVLGCTTKAVETRLYRARQILRERLARWA
ncbi:MAG: sigma-70 family RNA polymerase sigma factor [Verrucomicrobiota bacterium]